MVAAFYRIVSLHYLEQLASRHPGVGNFCDHATFTDSVHCWPGCDVFRAVVYDAWFGIQACGHSCSCSVFIGYVLLLQARDSSWRETRAQEKTNHDLDGFGGC